MNIDYDAGSDPTDIVAGASLTQGTRYTCQNVGTVATLYARIATAQPAVTDRAFRIAAGGEFTIRPSGTPVWVWTDDPNGCPLTLAEVA